MRARVATCHPDRPHRARGLCKPCYESVQYHANPESNKARVHQWRQAHPAAADAINRRSQLRRYDLTIEGYDAMLVEQGGACAICGGANANGWRLSVDHDHTTKMNRALLCGSCNQAVGLFRDDPAIMRAAAVYVEGHAA